ncbi:MAG: hypothetical protein D6726_09395 [Nitrospirae bacterium]|nr:MAG: hypothetical protein D6726_09395 [Nitrospirota bacterium]
MKKGMLIGLFMMVFLFGSLGLVHATCTMQVNKPLGGEQLVIGNYYSIQWNSCYKPVDVYLLKNNNILGLIASKVAPSLFISTHNWHIGDYDGGVAAPGSNYQIMIKSVDNTEKAVSGYFGLITGPVCEPLTTIYPIAVPTSLPDAMVGVQYNKSIQYSGGYAPVTCSIYNGNLPPGLAISSQCVILGKANKSGNYEFGIRIEDSCPLGTKSLIRLFKIKVKNLIKFQGPKRYKPIVHPSEPVTLPPDTFKTPEGGIIKKSK